MNRRETRRRRSSPKVFSVSFRSLIFKRMEQFYRSIGFSPVSQLCCWSKNDADEPSGHSRTVALLLMKFHPSSSSSYPCSSCPIAIASNNSNFHLFLHNVLWLWNGTCDTLTTDEMMCMCWKQYSNYAEYTGRPAERRADGKRDVEMCGERRRRWLKWNWKSTACSNTVRLASGFNFTSHPVFRRTSRKFRAGDVKKQARKKRETRSTSTTKYLRTAVPAKIGQIELMMFCR